MPCDSALAGCDNFNKVRKQEEIYGSVFNVHGAYAFNLFISNAGLEEIHLGGCSFTWCHKTASKMSKLDRFLVSEGIMSACLNISAITLDRYLSDHRPILMHDSKFDFVPTPFSTLSLLDIDKLESMELEQKAKIKWGIEGDENTKYYHGTLNKQRSQLAIRGVLNRFDHPQSSRIQIDMDFPIQLGLEQQEDMECNITREEIKRAVWDYGTDKSPGPDGFTSGFYRRFWCVIENDVVEAVNMFFQNATFPKGGNASFIALILKTHDANMVKDFRPITLIGSLYKIIAKILANRLVSVLGDIGDLISPLLFLLVMKSLHLSVQRVVDAGLFRGITICPSLQLSHLFYVDDAVFMGQWSESNINVIIKVLDCFYRASGLRINMNKSKLMGLSVDNDKAKVIKGIHGKDSKIEGRHRIQTSIPRIYDLESIKKIYAASKLGQDSLGFSLCRAHRGGTEQSQFNALQMNSEGIVLADSRDRWSWSLEGSGDFSVAYVRRVIDENILLSVSSKTHWVNTVPIKVNIHAWKVKLDFLPTRLNISRLVMNIESILCLICHKEVESSSHIFFACHFIREVFSKIATWWDVLFIEMSTYEEWLLWISNLRLPFNNKQMLEGSDGRIYDKFISRLGVYDIKDPRVAAAFINKNLKNVHLWLFFMNSLAFLYSFLLELAIHLHNWDLMNECEEGSEK
ncbi:RNA-directed DNA polymerase, eukaryota [Tanacetum coccineum]